MVVSVNSDHLSLARTHRRLENFAKLCVFSKVRRAWMVGFVISAVFHQIIKPMVKALSFKKDQCQPSRLVVPTAAAVCKSSCIL